MTTAANANAFPPSAAAAAPRRDAQADTAFGTFKRLLKPIASLRITVALLAMAILVVFAGTSAQKELGIWDVQARYFYAWWCWIPFKYLFPLSGTAWAKLGGGFYFPGGYAIIVALLVNLLAAHTARFKFNWKRSGILLIHFGLILLLVGELATSIFKHEDQLTFREGDTRQWAQDLHSYEIAIAERGAGANGTDKVTVIGDQLLRSDHAIRDAALPFDVHVDRWYENSQIAGPMQQEGKVERLATAGSMKDVGIVVVPKFTGVEAERVDVPGAFVTLTPKGGGQPLGTYVLNVDPRLAEQEVVVGEKRYAMALRFERTYFPYKVTLLDFAHDKYAGTEMARNFSSRIRLDDPAAGSPREVTIRMNEPLRYAGRTFFQSGFDPEDDKVTTLQVVDNPAWTFPYIACAVGTLGMLIHFGMHLVSFLRKRAQTGELIGFGPSTPVLARATASRKEKKRKPVADDRGVYTLAPRPRLAGILVPLALVGVFALYVVSVALRAPGVKDGQPDYATLGKVPVSFDGRIMPLDTLARSSLKIIHNKQEFKDPNDKTVTAIHWLADVMAGRPEADQYRVFRIDHPDIKSMLGLDELTNASRKAWTKGDPDPLDGKNFSYDNILYSRPGNPAALQKQVDAARQTPDKRRNTYQRKVVELYDHLALHMRLAQVAGVLDLSDIWSDTKHAEQFAAQVQPLVGVDPATLTVDQRVLMSKADRLDQQIRRLRQLQQDEGARTQDLYFLPPAKADAAWAGLGQTLAGAAGSGSLESLPADMRTFLGMMRDYRDDNVASFNAGAAQYVGRLGATHGSQSDKASFEAFYNRFDPFFISFVLYVAAFVLVLISWTAFQQPMWRSAAGLLGLALLVHTVGLVMRVSISGRPPVTNLYSSAVFIAWGAVVMAALFEIVFRNGIGFACAAVVGSLSLLIAGGLATEGDTMKQLQAVLDTNFWLATHVVVITLGYAATFLAMALAMAYVIGGMATPNLDSGTRKNLVRMVYGVMCFAMLFSFVGTILGGIWADQSWGRFWGWDPKENGAVLIVLWVALVLHARWGGVVRERGFMLLTVLGGIITGWSWFGTNMMGVGLHSYGFMEKGIFWLALFTVTDLTIVLVSACVPQRLWWSHQAEANDAGAATSNARGFTPLAAK